MMTISETKLSSVIFIVAAIALLTSWSLWAMIQHCGFQVNSNLKNPTHSALEFLLFNFLIAAVFLSSLKPLSSDRKVEDEIHMQCLVAEIEEGMNDGDDNDVDGCSGDDECDGGSECCEDDEDYVHDDDIDSADLEKRADEFIAKMTQGWMEERMKEKLSYALSMKSN